MTKNEIVGRLKDGGLDASSTNRNAAKMKKHAAEMKRKQAKNEAK